jgi:hypothetical protein
MSVLSPAERLRRASQLWHVFLQVTGQRFELAQFVSNAAVERSTIETALASGDRGLIGLAQEWLKDTGQALYVAQAPSASAGSSAAGAKAAAPAVPAAPRYLRGVR